MTTKSAAMPRAVSELKFSSALALRCGSATVSFCAMVQMPGTLVVCAICDAPGRQAWWLPRQLSRNANRNAAPAPADIPDANTGVVADINPRDVNDAINCWMLRTSTLAPALD